jgi:hypothetical protein
MNPQTASICFAESDLIASDWPGRVTVRSQVADSRVSILPDGSVSSRPNSTEVGPWELAYRVGNKLVWRSSQYPTGSYALPLAEGV